MDLLGPTHTLHLYLVEGDEPAYRARVDDAAAARPNVHVHPPVAPDAFATTINAYDIGVHLRAPTNINHGLALPNKLFDSVQARLATVVSPTPTMVAFVPEHDIGVVADGYE